MFENPTDVLTLQLVWENRDFFCLSWYLHLFIRGRECNKQASDSSRASTFLS